MVTDDQDFIDKLVRYVGRQTIIGYNPLVTIENHEWEEESEDIDYGN